MPKVTEYDKSRLRVETGISLSTIHKWAHRRKILKLYEATISDAAERLGIQRPSVAEAQKADK